MEPIIQQLQWALQALAQPAQVQISLYPEFVVVADELALDFNHWLITAKAQHSNKFTDHHLEALEAIDEFLTSMSGQDNAHHWTIEAIHKDSYWAEVRLLAKQALTVLAWSMSVPPLTSERGAIYVSRK